MSTTVPQCGVCLEQDSKYKCPVCELRYCSIKCYKLHKEQHTDTEGRPSALPKKDRPGTTQRVAKVDFASLKDDPDFARLLSRYSLLKIQLQMLYGLTLDPGPEDARSWNRQPLYGDGPSEPFRGRGRGRGRAFGGRGGRGRGGNEPQSDRSRGPWTDEKGEKDALTVIKRMREGTEDDPRAEGLREFGELCRMKFGHDNMLEGGEGARA